jgi:anti-anti-sigma factor
MTRRDEAALICRLEHDFPVTVVRVIGKMTYASAPVLRRAVQKGIVDHPVLLLVDVSAVEVVDDVTVTAFAALAQQGVAAEVSLVLVGPAPPLAAQLEALGIGHTVPVYQTEELARAAFAERTTPWHMQVDLEPVPAATAVARELVDEACARWRLGDLADTAALIATELVANAVQHAGTAMVFSVARRRYHLHLSCRDRSFAVPRRGAGDDGDDMEENRGLLVIESVAAGWGFNPTPDGKVVWATVRSRR